MLLFNILLTTAFCIVQICMCNGADVQYAYKVVSDTKGDWFAYSLATAAQRLVISAPYGSYILPEPSMKVRAPQGSEFGVNMDVNDHFIVASGWRPDSVYVYSSTHPYTLVARIPLDDAVMDVKVTDDNSIIVSTHDSHIAVFEYNHGGSWSKYQKIVVEDYVTAFFSLAVSGEILAVGYNDGDGGRVRIYNKVNNQFTYTTTLRQPEHVSDFGLSVAIEGRHLVVSSYKAPNRILYTYELDPSGGKWMMRGRLVVPGAYAAVSLQNNILAATVTDRHNNPEVCAYAYKLSKNRHTTTTNNNSASNDTLFTWKKVATLKTNGVPIRKHQDHNAISVQDGLILTGRMDSDGYGGVFVHDINKE